MTICETTYYDEETDEPHSRCTNEAEWTGVVICAVRHRETTTICSSCLGSVADNTLHCSLCTKRHSAVTEIHMKKLV